MQAYHLKIEGLGSSGEGVGNLGGLKVFVEGALPEEEIEIELAEKKSNYALGKLKRLIKASPHRTQPVCPIFDQCGGCQIMHLQEQAQLQAKRQRVIDALKRIAHLNPPVEPCVSSPQFLHYRNKIQLPLIWENGQCQLGLYRRQSHEIIPIETCAIQCRQGEEILKAVKPLLSCSDIRYLLIRNAIRTQEALLIFVTHGRASQELKIWSERHMHKFPYVKGILENIQPKPTNTILGTTLLQLAGRPYIYEKILDKTFRISAPSFFQVNVEQAENLYQKTMEIAQLETTDVVIDAFCGVGAFALFAADHSKQVIGIECVTHAIADARENALINQKNVQFFCDSAEKRIPFCPKPDVIFLNPPRKGCEPSLLKQIHKWEVQKILYVSCDPATLARDLRHLCDHGYRVETVQPFDMFPQTMHVETVVLLKKRLL
jgi:23S rRNA (uracil1939-C5)-methyltransferase